MGLLSFAHVRNEHERAADARAFEFERRVKAKLADRDWREETDAMYLPAAWPLLDADDPIAFAARMKQLREGRARAEVEDEMWGVPMDSAHSESVRHYRAQFPQPTCGEGGAA